MNSYQLAHSPACERNTPPLLKFLEKNLNLESKDGTTTRPSFLEIGFGTGQHAFSFSQHFSSIDFYACDQTTYHPHLHQRIEVLGRPSNLFGPFELKANPNGVNQNLPLKSFDFIFSANTMHIMSWPVAQSLLKALPSLMNGNAQLFLYGPFKFEGQFTSESNHAFDLSLKSNAPHMGIRDYEEICSLLKAGGLLEVGIEVMPANNHILKFKAS